MAEVELFTTGHFSDDAMWLNHKLKNKDHPCIEAQEKSVIVLIKDVSENEIKVREQIASLSVPQAGTEQKVSLGESWKSDPLVTTTIILRSRKQNSLTRLTFSLYLVILIWLIQRQSLMMTS